jgi:hypothetical protein
MKGLISIALAMSALAVTLGGDSVATGASAPPATYPVGDTTRESWADTSHGWRFAGAKRGIAYPLVQATENGGRTWHTILRQPRGLIEISRSTATDGIAMVQGPRKPLFVTIDNGRHWKAIGLVPRGFPVQASGHDAYWLTPTLDEKKLYRMTNALLGRTRTRVIVTLPENWIFEAVEPVPGGVAALANKFRPDDSKYQLVVYRYGKLRTYTIAQARRSLVCPLSIHAFTVDWPRLTVVTEEATYKAGQEYSCNFSSRTTAFVSTDGGAKWVETPTP